MSDNCSICNGLIMEPNKAYGYAGKVCYCSWKQNSIGINQHTIQTLLLEIESLKKRIKELENE